MAIDVSSLLFTKICRHSSNQKQNPFKKRIVLKMVTVWEVQTKPWSGFTQLSPSSQGIGQGSSNRAIPWFVPDYVSANGGQAVAWTHLATHPSNPVCERIHSKFTRRNLHMRHDRAGNPWRTWNVWASIHAKCPAIPANDRSRHDHDSLWCGPFVTFMIEP